MILLLRFASSLLCELERTVHSLMKRTLRWIPIVTRISFWTITFLLAKHVGWFSFPGGLFPVGSLFPRNSVVESWTVANPFLFLLILAYSFNRSSFRTYLLESIDILLSFVRNLHCLFPLPFDSPLAAAPLAGFSRCLSQEENASHDFLFQVSDQHCFKSDVVSRFTFLNSIFNAQRQQWLQLF